MSKAEQFIRDKAFPNGCTDEFWDKWKHEHSGTNWVGFAITAAEGYHSLQSQADQKERVELKRKVEDQSAAIQKLEVFMAGDDALKNPNALNTCERMIELFCGWRDKSNTLQFYNESQAKRINQQIKELQSAADDIHAEKEKSAKLVEASTTLNASLDIEWNKPAFERFKETGKKKVCQAQKVLGEALKNHEQK